MIRAIDRSDAMRSDCPIDSFYGRPDSRHDGGCEADRALVAARRDAQYAKPSTHGVVLSIHATICSQKFVARFNCRDVAHRMQALRLMLSVPSLVVQSSGVEECGNFGDCQYPQQPRRVHSGVCAEKRLGDRPPDAWLNRFGRGLANR